MTALGEAKVQEQVSEISDAVSFPSLVPEMYRLNFREAKKMLAVKIKNETAGEPHLWLYEG